MNDNKGFSPPWAVWVKRNGELSVPKEATFEDLCELADKILDYAAKGLAASKQRKLNISNCGRNREY